MPYDSVVMFEDEYQDLVSLCEKLLGVARAKAVLLVDRNGQYITCHGNIDHLDTTSLASLTAGNVAASQGLAKLLGEEAFPTMYHEGEHDHLHVSMVLNRAILVVMFDHRSNLGLVRLRVRRVTDKLARVFERIEQKSQSMPDPMPLKNITDKDIDQLFCTST